MDASPSRWGVNMLSQQIAEMQSAFFEKNDTIRTAMDTQLQEEGEKNDDDDTAKLQQITTEASFLRAQFRQARDLWIQFPKSFSARYFY